MLKKLKKFISTKKVATAFFAIGFFILAAIMFLIIKNEMINTSKRETLLLNNLKFHAQELEYLTKGFNPNEPQQAALSSSIDSLELLFEAFYDMEAEERKSIALGELTREEQIIRYTKSLLKKIKPSINYLSFKQIVKDSSWTRVEQAYVNNPNTGETTLEKVTIRENRKYFDKTTREQIQTASIIASKIKEQFVTLHAVYDHKAEEKTELFERITVIVACLLFILLASTYFILRQIYLLPLQEFNKYSGALLAGNYKSFAGEISREFKTIAQTVNSLIKEINTTANILGSFKINKIDDSQQANKTFLETPHPLPSAVNLMFKNLSDIAQQEQQRSWAVQGLAKFTNLLNRNIDNINDTLNDLLPELIRYTNALQGAIFLNYNATGDEAATTMDLAALYAYDRRKYHKHTLEIGQGLSGEVWQEKTPLIINNLPSDHAYIKSGLGEKTPTALAIFPIIESGIVYGILEIASFQKFEKHKTDLIQSIVEVLANTIASFEINQRTKNLLTESQSLAQQMRQKDIEMNKHLKDLESTKAEMEKSEALKENEIKALRIQIDSYEDRVNSIKRQHAEELENVSQKMVNNTADNQQIKKLQNELDQATKTYEQEILDLKETIKIKDMRIDKLRKKLQNNS